MPMVDWLDSKTETLNAEIIGNIFEKNNRNCEENFLTAEELKYISEDIEVFNFDLKIKEKVTKRLNNVIEKHYFEKYRKNLYRFFHLLKQEKIMKKIKEIIDEIAQVISKEYHILGSPMKETIKKMNIKIINVDRIYDILNGTIRRNDKQLFEILLYPNGISEEKANFTLAREIGHLLLHIGTDIKENDLSVQKTFNFSIEEKDDAELFAFAFLMPKIEFRQKLLETRKENYADLETVAKYFNVTIGKARQRAYQLELLKTIV